MYNELDLAESYKIKVVEPIRRISRAEREKSIEEAGFNVFNLKWSDVYIDVLTDSGTSAMSDNQWAGLVTGDETYAGCRNFFNLKDAVRDVLGLEYVIPAHQGRATENYLFSTLISKGDIVPFNMPFDTTDAHIKNNGATPVNCVIDNAYDPGDLHPFKGNVDISKLKQVIEKHGVGKIPFIIITATNNSGGGQPVSLENFREVREVADHYKLPVFMDAARCAENAHFIKVREKGCQQKSVAEILKEMFSYVDGCTFSAKKDPMVNIGGFIGLRSKEIYARILPTLILYEGFATYGGLAGRDLEAMARGLYEMVDDEHIANRVGQVAYLGDKLTAMGVQVVRPIGGHAVFIDAAHFFPQLPQDQFPADVLSVELYIESGVRGLGLGFLAFGEKDPVTGEVAYPELELFRLAIPRRVYTNRHMDYIAEGVRRVFERRTSVKGLAITEEPEVLRHFLARFIRAE